MPVVKFEKTRLRYQSCSYGIPQMQFRGPECDRSQPHLVYFGGAETYGRFMDNPFPELVEQQTGYGTVNLGLVNGGLEFFANSAKALQLANEADGVVVEVLGAAQLTNTYFKVHPRRNDRVLAASSALARMIPDLDTADVHFIRHFLQELRNKDQTTFEEVCAELQETWVKRMLALFKQITVPIHLVWISTHEPATCRMSPKADDPLFVNEGMLDMLAPMVVTVTEVVVPLTGVADQTLRFSEFEKPAAQKMLGQAAHTAVAANLSAALERQKPRPKARVS